MSYPKLPSSCCDSPSGEDDSDLPPEEDDNDSPSEEDDRNSPSDEDDSDSLEDDTPIFVSFAIPSSLFGDLDNLRVDRED